ncbi:Omp28-related outer membrane protein [Portibacter marinus]|uniref:Omp28-related outer membrane protein n=1 Tax=Portibacter marinus TaxID=2898660 RepID=UPI001F461CD4|nr:Omp28-related outer membrane protein [Portibacter marinus]
MRYLAVIAVLFTLLGCEGSIVRIPEFEAIESQRVVLLEEMTGVSCPNCPKGTSEIEAIKQRYGDQVIPVGIHGFFLSWPTKESEFDFRNDFAKQLEMTLAPGTSKPAALINRAIPSGGETRVIQSPDLWSGYVADQLRIPPRVSVVMETSIDVESREMVLRVGVIGLENINESLKMSVMILENNIIDAQEDLNDIIEDFHHNHVLRTMLTTYDGMELSSGLEEGQVVNQEFQYVIPKDEHLWKIEDLEIVVFVHEAGSSGEVLQAGLVKLL